MSNTLTCLDQLIAFDTVSRNSNLPCIAWAKSLLEAAGARISLDWNSDRSKANLFATFGAGPGGIVLSGHVDVVPIDGQPWTSNPFKLRIADGKAYGRGACDMKGFIAAVLGHATDIGCARLRQPVHVALTYDEELGCLGIPQLIKHLAREQIMPAGCLVGEPTGMRLVSAHKGGEIYRCVVTGKAAHSSLTPTTVNAVQIAARIIARIADIAERQARSGLRVDGFDVPHTTISTNLMTGGSGPNIVPAEAEFLFDYRYVPGDDPKAIIGELRTYAENELLPRMRVIDERANIVFTRVNSVPSLSANADAAVYGLVHGLLDDTRVEKVSYGTEASFFEAYGVPSVVCGPGSIEQAHKADEYVTLDQLAACDRMLAGLIAKLSSQ
jgi:acetylornithine deacetylase